MFFQPKPAPKPVGHPSQDETPRFTDDQRLRKYGFAIHSRPKDGVPLWTYGRDIYDELEALDLVDDMEEVERK